MEHPGVKIRGRQKLFGTQKLWNGLWSHLKFSLPGDTLLMRVAPGYCAENMKFAAIINISNLFSTHISSLLFESGPWFHCKWGELRPLLLKSNPWPVIPYFYPWWHHNVSLHCTPAFCTCIYLLETIDIKPRLLTAQVHCATLVVSICSRHFVNRCNKMIEKLIMYLTRSGENTPLYLHPHHRPSLRIFA